MFWGALFASILILFGQAEDSEDNLFELIKNIRNNKRKSLAYSPVKNDQIKIIETASKYELENLKLENEIYESQFEEQQNTIYKKEEVDNEDSISTIEGPKEIIIKFRILKSVKLNNEIKCFITNEGDTLENISLWTKNNLTGSIEPKKIFKSKDAGLLKFSGVIDLNSDIEFILKFGDNLSPKTKNFVYRIGKEIIEELGV
jgi:hypothetical protein